LIGKVPGVHVVVID